MILAEECVVETRFTIVGKTALKAMTKVAASTPEAAYGYALALLLDRSKGWARRVRQCKWRDCENFFLAPAVRGGGSGKSMCSDECRRKARNESAKISRNR